MRQRYHCFLLQQRHEARGEKRWTVYHQQSGASVIAPSITEAASWIASIAVPSDMNASQRQAITAPGEDAARNTIGHGSCHIIHDR